MKSHTAHKHKAVSIRDTDYAYLADIASLLQLRDKRRVSLCEAMNWLVQQAKALKVTIESSPELRITKK